jgi:hypothetical protein
VISLPPGIRAFFERARATGRDELQEKYTAVMAPALERHRRLPTSG